MLLIIPLIEIRDGKCLQRVQGTDGTATSDDPSAMARLWRQENAKSLHVTDIDGVLRGHPVNFDAVRRMTASVDIPIELSGGLRTLQDVQQAFGAGIYRAVIGSAFIQQPEEAQRILDAFGGSKIVLGVDVQDNIVMIKGMTEKSGLTPLSVALNAKQMGFRRIIYRDARETDTRKVRDHGAIKTVAEKSGLRVTVFGDINGLEDLLKLQELEPAGVDSVIIGRAFYENKFSCQRLWRLCEAGNYPSTAKV